MGAQNAEVVGKCIECNCPYEEFSGRKVCTVCRDLVLVCDNCFEGRHGEVHCTDHRIFKDCYFTFIQYLTREELVNHREQLEEILEAHVQDKAWKNKRRTVRKQIDKITKQIEALDAGEASIECQEKAASRSIHCRTCGAISCMGNCWGFWNEPVPAPTAKRTKLE